MFSLWRLVLLELSAVVLAFHTAHRQVAVANANHSAPELKPHQTVQTGTLNRSEEGSSVIKFPINTTLAVHSKGLFKVSVASSISGTEALKTFGLRGDSMHSMAMQITALLLFVAVVLMAAVGLQKSGPDGTSTGLNKAAANRKEFRYYRRKTFTYSASAEAAAAKSSAVDGASPTTAADADAKQRSAVKSAKPDASAQASTKQTSIVFGTTSRASAEVASQTAACCDESPSEGTMLQSCTNTALSCPVQQSAVASLPGVGAPSGTFPSMKRSAGSTSSRVASWLQRKSSASVFASATVLASAERELSQHISTAFGRLSGIFSKPALDEQDAANDTSELSVIATA